MTKTIHDNPNTQHAPLLQELPKEAVTVADETNRSPMKTINGISYMGPEMKVYSETDNQAISKQQGLGGKKRGQGGKLGKEWN
jgi:hypothetical protein